MREKPFGSQSYAAFLSLIMRCSGICSASRQGPVLRDSGYRLVLYHLGELESVR